LRQGLTVCRGSRSLLAWIPAGLVGTLLILSTVVGASCGSATEAATEQGRFAQTGSEMSMTLQVDPFPPRSMREATFTITVADLSGVPLEGATVTCDMTMPAMPMPANRPEAVEGDPGVYTAQVLFTMAGGWEAAVQVALPDGRAETFTFAMSTG
jgi:YtkA-like